MSEFHVNGYFTYGEMWALLYALDVLDKETPLSEEQWKFVESARNRLLDAVE